MAKRFTDTELWDKEWFMKLKPKIKCLVKYVRDKCNLAGVWEPNWSLAATHINEKVTEMELLSVDNGQQFLKTDDEKIFCIGFISFQYGQKLNEKSPVHRKIIDLLNKSTFKKHTLYDTLFNRVYNTLMEEEEDKEEEKGMDKEEEKEEVLLWPTFENFWDDYDKKIDKPKCEVKWNVLTQQQKEAIMAYIPDYKKYQPDKQYRKNPLTFLSNLSWENELIKSNGNSANTDRVQKVDELRAFSEGMDIILGVSKNKNSSSSSIIDTEATIIESNTNARNRDGESFNNQTHR